MLKTHVTGRSAHSGAKEGDSDEGDYLTAGLKSWYEKHPEVKTGEDGSEIRFECLTPDEKYKLTIL